MTNGQFHSITDFFFYWFIALVAGRYDEWCCITLSNAREGYTFVNRVRMSGEDNDNYIITPGGGHASHLSQVAVEWQSKDF